MRLLKDFDEDNDSYVITLENISMDIPLSGDNWGRISGHVAIKTINFEFKMRNVDGQHNKTRCVNILKNISTSEEFLFQMRTSLNDIYFLADVYHDKDWDIYNDRLFEISLSEYLGFPIGFTEQGMQQNCIASMER